MPVTNPQQPSAGGVWKRIDRNGHEYFYFQVEVKGFMYTFRAFPNRLKTGPKQPDYRLFPVDEPTEVKQKWQPKPRPEGFYKIQPPPPDPEDEERLPIDSEDEDPNGQPPEDDDDSNDVPF